MANFCFFCFRTALSSSHRLIRFNDSIRDPTLCCNGSINRSIQKNQKNLTIMLSQKRKAFLNSLIDDCSMNDLMYLRGKIESLLEKDEETPPGIPEAIEVKRVVVEKREPKTPVQTRKPRPTNFYAIHGRVELCEIDGEKREMKVIGKTENELATMARDPSNGSLYAIDRASLLQIDPSKGKVRHVATIKCQGVPVRSIRGLCFSRNGNQAYCVALKGTIKSIKAGDAICRLNMKTGKLSPEVVIQLSDIVGLSVETNNSWLAWSSYEGLLRVTKTSLDSVSAQPVGISIRSLSSNENGDLYGIGDRLYEIRLSRNDDGAVQSSVVEPMTGALPVSCDGLVCRPHDEGFFSPSMKSPPEMRQDIDDGDMYTSPYSKISGKKSDTRTSTSQRSRPMPVSMEFSASEWNTPTTAAASTSTKHHFGGNFNPTTRRINQRSPSPTPAFSSQKSEAQTSSGRRRKPVAFVV